MAIQRVNFNALAAGGDTPTGALVKLDNNAADLDSRKANVADFASSLGLNGYVRLPGGLIYQWGAAIIATGNTTATVTFPIAFPNACLNVMTCNGYTAANQEAFIGVSTSTPSNFVAKNGSANTSACQVNWHAIGN